MDRKDPRLILKSFLFFAIVLFSLIRNLSAGFSETSISIIDLVWSAVAWGDFNNDSYMDFVISGQDSSSARHLSLYINNKDGTFTLKQNLGTGVRTGSLSWGDYDNDGDLDLAITGHVDDNYGLTKIYRNDNGTFVDSDISLQKVYFSAVSWGDYDNDGDLDLALTGLSAGTRYAILYKNNGDGTFTDTNQSLTGVWTGSLSWGDYNNDGFLDLALTGLDKDDNAVCKIYKNTQGVLIDAGLNIKPAAGSSFAWADYDNDGNLDFALMGSTTGSISENFCEIYHNQGPSQNYQFISTKTLTEVYYGKLAWGDYDNDGKIDLAICGETSVGNYITKVYKNEGSGVFTDIDLKGVHLGGLAWADYDNDKYIDLIISGSSSTTYGHFTRIYENDKALIDPNNIPPPVEDFNSRYFNEKLYIMWNDPPDTDETPVNGLYYNFRVGSSSGIGDLVPARYGSPLLGNYLTKVTSSTIDDTDIAAGNVDVSGYKHVRVLNISGSSYYWAVQTIDTSLGYSWAASYGEGWSEQQVFKDTTSPTGLATTPTDEGERTYNKELTFSWTKGTVDDPETGIYGCYIEVMEDGAVVESKELSEKLTKTVWDADGNASYIHTGTLNKTYKIRVKARHGYDQSLPTTTYRPDIYGTSGDPDGLWHPDSPHYTGWTNWSDGIKIVELLAINNNLIRSPGSGGDAVEIGYSLIKDGRVIIRIFNILGELVKTVIDKYVIKGEEDIEKWYGLTDSNKIVASGVYYINIQAAGSKDTQKVVVVK